MQIVGIVPAAGRALRLQPLAGSKEMLPVAGRPVMDYLVERMRRADATAIRVVTTPDKRDVIEHAEELGAEVVEGEPPTVCASLELGLADAGDAFVLLGFPDTIWEPLDGFCRVLESVGEGDAAVGVFRGREPERSDVVSLDEDGRVGSVRVKPAQPQGDLIWGCAAARPGGLEGLGAYDEPGEYLDALAVRGALRGVYLGARFVDVGTPDSLERAERGDW